MTTLRPSPPAPLEDIDHGRRKGRTWLPWLAAAVFLLGLAMAGIRIGLGWVPGTGKLGAGWAMMDFFSSMYYPVRAFLDGGNPHDARWFLHQYPVSDGYGPFLPINLVIHLPFALLQPVAASQVYFALSLLAAILLSALALRLAGVTVTLTLAVLVAGLLLLSRAGHWTLLLGQPAFLLACFCYLTLIHLRSAPLLAAAALSFAAYKPTFGVPLALILLVAGHARVVAAGAAIGLAVNLPLWWILGSRVGGIIPFFQNMLGNYQDWQSRPSLGASSNYRLVDASALFSRFVGHSLAEGTQLLIAIGIPVVAGLVIRRLDWDRETDRDLALGLACTALLLGTHHLGYDKVVLLAPLIALVLRGLPLGTPPALRWVFLSLYVIPAVNWITTDAVLGGWSGSHTVWLALASINSLCLAALFLGYLGVALAHGGGQHRPAGARISPQLAS